MTQLITPRTTKYVYDFAEGDAQLADLLGGKGANLAEMTRIGLPVPPGFVITTTACRAYLETGAAPSALEAEIRSHLERLEHQAGRRLGDPVDPLLVSVRSGARFSMPGMMETVLDIGLNDVSVHGLAVASGDELFAWDSYRRLIQMFGKTVFELPGSLFDDVLTKAQHRAQVSSVTDLSVEQLRQVTERFKDIILDQTWHEFPQDPSEQLLSAIRAVFGSWNSDRAIAYRRQERIPGHLGTAVTVMAMVYGNLGQNSGTGVAFTRDPASGVPGVYGDYLSDAQGEDVVAGERNTRPLADLESLDPRSFHELLGYLKILEQHYRDLCDTEFTIERGHLWMLQTRVGKRTAAAAFVIAAQLVDEGVIDLDEALARVSGAQLSRLMFPAFAPGAGDRVLVSGIPASPGAAVGAIALDQATARASAGPVVLVRRETTPDDLPGLIAAEGVLTGHGGKTSHAAVVARGMGKTCVCGAEALVIDEAARTVEVGGVLLREGDVISVDGDSGQVYAGAVRVCPSPLVEYFETGLMPPGNKTVAAVARLLEHADRRRRLQVQANADTPPDAERARRLGATGIGLCRTEHMFLGERRILVERLVLATTPEQVRHSLDALLPLQREDFRDILERMDGLPVTIRLIDPPLHEFLPRLEDLTEKVARAQGSPESLAHDRELLAAVRRIHEENPMLGLRGVRLGLVVPGLITMQARAVAEAAAQLVRRGLDPRPEIMVPLVATVHELEAAAVILREALAQVPDAPRIPVGTMIEVPRAALTAGDIAAQADFFSFGTNDLTQMGWGFSRDDVESAFFPQYLAQGILTVSPFESIDESGIGRLVELAVAEGRATRSDLRIGVCGEHGGDPASIGFFHRAHLDYVSCSPYRVPVARLEAGCAAVTATGSDSR
ncbi:pyruvate, phosphate dikinase [Kineosporia sp. NBRC 101731]|uniref:pyruvate, phosphate dikinase n=1 Tax=Kineosporia sp. NBRC 101731 TaxID=3032199 RepID=UPI0024A5CD89|nr:pyruvate, phosphate dikinase [Kineosporia sp. NBRC 101731]GLY32164.1 pyruvate, phosphate dikinase [Kineosporia sp. NBRC 101731]